MTGIQHIPADAVTDEFKALAAEWPTWDSDEAEPPLDPDGKVHFDYNWEYDSERVLVVQGSATLTPDDGSPPVTIGAGDSVHCHFGSGCTCTIHERIVQAYGYFGNDVNELKETDLTCDVCGVDCFEESYLCDG